MPKMCKLFFLQMIFFCLTVSVHFRKKQILSALDDKSKKSSDLKLYEKTQEDLLSRSTLIYPMSESAPGKQQVICRNCFLIVSLSLHQYAHIYTWIKKQDGH